MSGTLDAYVSNSWVWIIQTVERGAGQDGGSQQAQDRLDPWRRIDTEPASASTGQRPNPDKIRLPRSTTDQDEGRCGAIGGKPISCRTGQPQLDSKASLLAHISSIVFTPIQTLSMPSWRGVMPRESPLRQSLCAGTDGFGLHAVVRVEAHNRKRLEQRCCCITRPALPDELVQFNAAGQVELKLKTPRRDGTTHPVMCPAAAWITTASTRSPSSCCTGVSTRAWSSSASRYGAPGAPKMVSILDILNDALSPVSTFYEVETRANRGTRNVLWQIEQTRALKLPHVYLGHRISRSDTIDCKAQFAPQGWLIEGRWPSPAAALR